MRPARVLTIFRPIRSSKYVSHAASKGFASDLIFVCRRIGTSEARHGAIMIGLPSGHRLPLGAAKTRLRLPIQWKSRSLTQYFRLFGCLRQHHCHNPCLTLVFSHSSNGDCFAAERMGQQPLQGFRVTPAAFLYHLDDTCASGGTEDCAAWPRVGTVITGYSLAA